MTLDMGHPVRPGPRARAAARVLLALAALLVADSFLESAGQTPGKAATWPPPMTVEEREVEKQVREIASKLRAPCCPELTLEQHNSPDCLAAKADIRRMIREGKGEAEIVRALREKYGDAISPVHPLVFWKPYLYAGGGLLGAGLILLLGRWMMVHEKEPVVLHVTDEEGPSTPTKDQAA